jgi:hypothetical protein
MDADLQPPGFFLPDMRYLLASRLLVAVRSGVVPRLHAEPSDLNVDAPPAMCLDRPRGVKSLKETHNSEHIGSSSFRNHGSPVVRRIAEIRLFIDLENLDLDQLFQRQVIQAAGTHSFYKGPVNMKDAHLYQLLFRRGEA